MSVFLVNGDAILEAAPLLTPLVAGILDDGTIGCFPRVSFCVLLRSLLTVSNPPFLFFRQDVWLLSEAYLTLGEIWDICISFFEPVIPAKTIS